MSMYEDACDEHYDRFLENSYHTPDEGPFGTTDSDDVSTGASDEERKEWVKWNGF